MSENEKTEEISKIETTLGHYFNGYLKAESEILLKGFHPISRLLAVDQRQLSKTELSEWVNNLRDRKARGDIRQADVKILNIDVEGDAAVAKAELRFKKFIFTDYLSLLKVDGDWIIVNKIYSTRNI